MPRRLVFLLIASALATNGAHATHDSWTRSVGAETESRSVERIPLDLLDLAQWPAMAITVAAAWMIASTRPWKRRTGFWLFLLSNALWVVWGCHTDAWALIVLQLCLAALNIRGMKKTDAPAEHALT